MPTKRLDLSDVDVIGPQSMTKSNDNSEGEYTIRGRVKITGPAPRITLYDETGSAKSVIVSEDANKLHIYESAGAAGDIISVDLANKRVGIGKSDPDKKLQLWGGDQEIADPTDLGPESLAETDFATHATWDVTGDCDDSGGNATFAYATGTATLTQTAANQAVAAVGSRWYKFIYTVTGATGTISAVIETEYALTAEALDLTNGTHTLYFRSALIPTDFVIVATLAAASGFVLDNVSLLQILGGDIEAHGGVKARAFGVGVTPVVRGAALTAQLTTVTHTAPGTPDYAIADLIQPAGYGFVSLDEGLTVLSVIANLQTRLAQLEARLVPATGNGLIASP